MMPGQTLPHSFAFLFPLITLFVPASIIRDQSTESRQQSSGFFSIRMAPLVMFLRLYRPMSFRLVISQITRAQLQKRLRPRMTLKLGKSMLRLSRPETRNSSRQSVMTVSFGKLRERKSSWWTLLVLSLMRRICRQPSTTVQFSSRLNSLISFRMSMLGPQTERHNGRTHQNASFILLIQKRGIKTHSNTAMLHIDQQVDYFCQKILIIIIFLKHLILLVKMVRLVYGHTYK